MSWSDREARAMDDIAEAMELLSRKFPDRRERIATAALQGVLANPRRQNLNENVWNAVAHADALIAELDKEVQP